MQTQRTDVLPASLPPVGINREQAAALIGVGTSLFDKAVEIGTMPKPRMIGERLVYDVAELIDAFRKLPHKGGEQDPLDATFVAGNAFDNAKKARR
ncbi:helix-turn-helix transcriptional regulator [Rhizobium sp. LEGMi198b]